MGKKEDIETVKKFKKEASQKIPLDKVIFFGSRARGKIHEWSDFDLIVVSKKLCALSIFEYHLVREGCNLRNAAKCDLFLIVLQKFSQSIIDTVCTDVRGFLFEKRK